MNEQMTLKLNNGLTMPMAGIGTFLLSPDEAEASCVSALACGYRLIDTANAYVNERAVGRAMKKSGSTRRWYLWWASRSKMKKPVVRRAIDLLMTAALLLLMSYSLAVGEAVHEWTGMGMFLLSMFHLVLNRKWLQSLSRGRYTARRPYSFLPTIWPSWGCSFSAAIA